METIERLESQVRSYCRSFPAVFESAQGHCMVDRNGREYLDFFAGAGALNYGHNEPALKRRLIEYLGCNGVVHSLDMATRAKEAFLERFEAVVLAPRKLEYVMQFPGPTGTNAVEAALKLARKVTGRSEVVAFTNAFHGMTLGSLAVTGNGFKRAGAGTSLSDATAMPYDGYLGPEVDTIEVIRRFLEDRSSGLDRPAAFVVETIQAEGGVNVARVDWLRRLQGLARSYDILLIIDDIQVGCGRTGPFFSFEPAGIEPDMICLSKALSGYGLPLSLTLIKPELDRWEPGEHNGTFRGHNPAFVTATEALSRYWTTDQLTDRVIDLGHHTRARLASMAAAYPDVLAEVRGRGLIQGLVFREGGLATRISRACFERGLIIETAGAEAQVLKVLPPLTIGREALDRGLQIIERALADLLGAAHVSSSWASRVEVTAP